jgi:hypothetical protein
MSQAIDVGAPVEGVVLTHEVVVGGQMNDEIGATAVADMAKNGQHRLSVGNVELEPGDVGVRRHFALGLRASGYREDLIVVPE